MALSLVLPHAVSLLDQTVVWQEALQVLPGPAGGTRCPSHASDVHLDPWATVVSARPVHSEMSE